MVSEKNHTGGDDDGTEVDSAVGADGGLYNFLLCEFSKGMYSNYRV